MNAMNLQDRLSHAVRAVLELPESIDINWTVPKHTDQGDLATNVAMILAKEWGRPPRDIASEVIAAVDWAHLGMDRVEIAGPGFINLWISPAHYHEVVRTILREGSEYGNSDAGQGKSILVEFVSANPTGPLNVVSARAAAIGDSMVRLLRKAGYDGKSEFYVNDAGRQVRRLGESVLAHARGEVIPEDGYHGAYVRDLATSLFGNQLPELDSDPDAVGKAAADLIVEHQQQVLEAYGVQFDRWFHESELHSGDAADAVLQSLRDADAVYEKDGASWFAGTRFGDLEDRVIITREGRPTYLLPDIAYHCDKLERAEKVVDLLGPDHHDYVGRMQAALAALGFGGRLEVIIVQQVHLMEGGEKVKMSKRAGKLVTLEELVQEVGKDVARYFFLQRRTSTPLDFDLDLAKEQSDRNPVYYVQYAHTRIRGILRQSGCPSPSADADLTPLVAQEEIELIKHLEQFGTYVVRAAEAFEPQRLVGWLADLATRFHKFYTACQVVGVDPDISLARASLVEAAGIVLAEGLHLLGVSAPERM